MAIDRSAKGTVWNIQILRFVAAAMVLFSHLENEVSKWPKMVSTFTWFDPVWWPSGVDIFFIISGFIMFYISADAFGRPDAAKDFLRRRIIRLVPPYWMFTALTLVVMQLFGQHMRLSEVRLPQVIGSFVFIPASNPQGKPFPVLILGWTLEYEMLFYAIFAIGLLFRRATGLAFIFGALVALSAADLAAPLPLPVGYWANPIILEFVFGIGLAMAYRRGLELSLPLRGLLILAAIGLMMWVQSGTWLGHSPPWRFLWAGVPAFLLCAGVVLQPRTTALPGRIGRVFIYLGDTSYALYLSHPFVLAPVAFLIDWLNIVDGHVFVALSMIACIVAAAGFYQFVERPMYRFLSGSGMSRTIAKMLPALR